MQTARGDGVAGIKRRRCDLSSDGVRNLATTSGRGRLKRGYRIIYMATTSGLQRDANHIRTLGDYSKPSHEGYRNTIELPVANNVVTDIAQKDKHEAKRTKPSTGMERVQETKSKASQSDASSDVLRNDTLAIHANDW
ncbi:hypothetical protein Tco_0496345 [Tanacetum coccineum]